MRRRRWPLRRITRRPPRKKHEPSRLSRRSGRSTLVPRERRFSDALRLTGLLPLHSLLSHTEYSICRRFACGLPASGKPGSKRLIPEQPFVPRKTTKQRCFERRERQDSNPRPPALRPAPGPTSSDAASRRFSSLCARRSCSHGDAPAGRSRDGRTLASVARLVRATGPAEVLASRLDRAPLRLCVPDRPIAAAA